MSDESLPVVLVVEDDQNLLDLYHEVLQERMVPATSVEEAEEAFSRHRDHCGAIIMDGHIIGSDPNTLDLVKKMRKTYSGPIISTSNDYRLRTQLYQAARTNQEGSAFCLNKDEAPFFVLERLLRSAA